MESQLRLSHTLGARLCRVCLYLALIGCGSSENQDIAEPPERGVDPFCETRPKIEFCEDFDVLALPGSFSEEQSSQSSMVLSSEESASLPNSMSVSVETGGTAELRHTFEVGGKLRLFGMLYVPELGDGDVRIGAFELGDYHIGFGVSEDGRLWAYEGSDRLEGQGELPVGRWASFRWDVNIYADGSGTANLRFGNDVMFETDALTTLGADGMPPTVVIGLKEATGEWQMFFDNITVSIEEVVE